MTSEEREEIKKELREEILGELLDSIKQNLSVCVSTGGDDYSGKRLKVEITYDGKTIAESFDYL
jgi:hypothetical protein